MIEENKRPKIIGKLYYRVEIENTSPFSIGGFDSDISQHDILVDCFNTPYIPGSSLKGSMIRGLSDDEAESLGTYLSNNGNGIFPLSNLFISNAYPYPVGSDQETIKKGSEKVRNLLSIRDGIKISHETNTVIDGAKYDYEIIQSGAVFYFDIEVTCRKNNSNSIIEYHNMIVKMLTKINIGDIRFGFKTTRGCGLFKVNKVNYGMFGDSCSSQLKDALDETKHYSQVLELPNVPESSDTIVLTCNITNPNGIIIRAEPDLDDSEKNHTDSVQIQDNGIAVIPGTSLNGALQSSIYNLCQYLNTKTTNKKIDYNKDIAPFFGQFGANDFGKSSVFVEETKLNGGKLRLITRTCINRFSGSAKNGALFNERIYFDGQGVIKIRAKINENDDWFVGLLVIAMDSISIGETSIGGEKTIGRGQLVGGEINVSKQTPDYYVEKLKEHIQLCETATL